MKLPTVEVVEMHYWAVLIRDEFRPDGEEWPNQFKTKEEAQAKADRLIAVQIATPENDADKAYRRRVM